MLETNKFNEAIEFRKKLSSTLNFEAFYFDIGMVNYYLSRGEIDTSQYILAKILSENVLPHHIEAEANLLLGICNFHKREFASAKAYFERAISMDPTPNWCDQLGTCWLARIHHLNGDIQYAETLFKSGCLPSTYWYKKWEALCMYGDFLFKEKHYSKARALYEEALAITPYFNKAYVGLAKCYLKKGDEKKALAQLALAMENYYPNPELLRADPDFRKVLKTKRFQQLLTDYKHLNNSLK